MTELNGEGSDGRTLLENGDGHPDDHDDDGAYQEPPACGFRERRLI
jgi:hypothetical protein